MFLNEPSIDLSTFMFNRDSFCTSIQLVEIDDISGFHHSLNDIPYTMVEDNPCILAYPTNSSQLFGYVNYEPMEACQDNEALRYQPMVMSVSHYFEFSSRINHNINVETLTQGTFHVYSIHGSH